VRALEVTVDANLLWVGAGLALTAAVALAYIPALPSSHTPAGLGLASGSIRMTPVTNRRLRLFAMTQIAFSFVLLAGAATLLTAFIALQRVPTGYEMRQVIAFDLPTPAMGFRNDEESRLYQRMVQRIGRLPNVNGVSLGTVVPWRDAGLLPGALHFTADGIVRRDTGELPTARIRIVATRFFDVLGVPVLAGREFSETDSSGSEQVVVVSQSLAELFPNGDPINHSIKWTDPILEKIPRGRIVGVVADVDDEKLSGARPFTVYQPVSQMKVAGRLFVHTTGDPYAIVPAVERIVHEESPDQPLENAATLQDVRAQMLTPRRVNAFVVTGFAGMALLIAVVGVASVLAFSVSARTREFGVRLAVGSAPRNLLARVLSEGVVIAAVGIVVGAIGGYAIAALADWLFVPIPLPGAVPVAVAAAVLVMAAAVASLMPAARASRVDVLQALRSE